MCVWNIGSQAAFCYIPTLFEGRSHKAKACRLLSVFQECLISSTTAAAAAPPRNPVQVEPSTDNAAATGVDLVQSSVPLQLDESTEVGQ